MTDRNFVLAVHNSCSTRIYNFSGSSEVNSFLTLFDNENRNGRCYLASDGNNIVFLFECSLDFYDILHTEDVKRAFDRMGVVLTFDAEDVVHLSSRPEI